MSFNTQNQVKKNILVLTKGNRGDSLQIDIPCVTDLFTIKAITIKKSNEGSFEAPRQTRLSNLANTIKPMLLQEEAMPILIVTCYVQDFSNVCWFWQRRT